MNARIASFNRVLFTGLGQIMLQESPLTGALFLLGVAVNSPLMALGAALGTMGGMVSADILRLSPENQRKGLYGFNGALVGIASVLFFTPTVLTIVLLFGGAFLSVVVMEMMLRRLSIPPYTAPFVLVTWGLLLVRYLLQLSAGMPGGLTAIPDVPLGGFKGLGQVMLQGNALSGVLFLLGILACSKARGLWALVASLVGGATAWLLGQPYDAIATGSFGANAALTGVSLPPSGMKVWALFVGFAFTVLLVFAFTAIGVPPLTAPFVIASWVTMRFLK